MISTVSPFRTPMMTRLPLAAAANPTPAPAPAPAPTPTSVPDIDFSTVDTPQKAALLPNVNGASFLVAFSLFANCLSFGASFTSQTNMTLGQSTTGSVTHTLADPKTPSLSVSGNIGGNALKETWSIDDKKQIQINGTIGNSAEKLTVKMANGVVSLDGTVGSVEVHEKFKGIPGNKILFGGTIGGQKLSQTIAPTQDSAGNQNLAVSGTLGSASITYNATGKATTDGSGLTWSGQGNIAGNAVKLDQNITISVPSKK